MIALFGFLSLLCDFYLAGLWFGPFTATPFLLAMLLVFRVSIAGIQIGHWIGRVGHGSP
jgi:hypothetical protein